MLRSQANAWGFKDFPNPEFEIVNPKTDALTICGLLYRKRSARKL